MTSPPLAPATLPTRPRRPKVDRPPSQRAAARALRRSAPPTTGRTWRRSRLPQPELAAAGVPFAEGAVSCALVGLLFVPVLLFAGFAPAAWVAAAVAVLAAGYVVSIRRVVVGPSYVAVRQLGRFHVATVTHVRHLELKPSSRGGVLCVHTDDGRCMRLRQAETRDPRLAAALRALSLRSDGTRDAQVERLLHLPRDERRLRHRYLADAVQ